MKRWSILVFIFPEHAQHDHVIHTVWMEFAGTGPFWIGRGSPPSASTFDTPMDILGTANSNFMEVYINHNATHAVLCLIRFFMCIVSTTHIRTLHIRISNLGVIGKNWHGEPNHQHESWDTPVMIKRPEKLRKVRGAESVLGIALLGETASAPNHFVSIRDPSSPLVTSNMAVERLCTSGKPGGNTWRGTKKEKNMIMPVRPENFVQNVA
jgi:hypothetical protein